mmetsp:Transcript_12497/g.26617  ORF Transcript_12497/g.26617 Transcript_12497/m.26617 type:complete len:228 (+) Transcript_12497:342-1025(+)
MTQSRLIFHLLPLLCRHAILHKFQFLQPLLFRTLHHFFLMAKFVKGDVRSSSIPSALGGGSLLCLALLSGVFLHFPFVVVIIFDVRQCGRVEVLGVFFKVFHQLMLRSIEGGYALDFREPALEGGFNFGVGMKVGGVNDSVFSKEGGASGTPRGGAGFLSSRAFFEDLAFVVRERRGRVRRGIIMITTFVAVIVTIPGPISASGMLFVLFAVLTAPFVMMSPLLPIS